MSSINTISNSPNLRIQNNPQVSNTQEQHKVHHHHHKDQSQDSIQISDDSKQASTSKPNNILDSLVSNGTISKDQESAIKSAFLSSMHANKTSTYGTSKTSPIDSLITNGTITQTQADSITNAFKSAFQPSQNT